MNFDQMLETWRAQDNSPPFDVNRDALRQALQTEEAKVQQELRTTRRSLWVALTIGMGMAVFAGFWIAISISNGWPAVYVVTSGASFGLFAFGAGAMWKSYVPRAEPRRNFGNTLQSEVRRSLALVDDQLSLTKRMIVVVLGAASITFGTLLFSWTLNKSQNIPISSSSGWLVPMLLISMFVWSCYKTREEMREAQPKLELRQRRLRELLAALDDRE
jgi:hypothetical protein